MPDGSTKVRITNRPVTAPQSADTAVYGGEVGDGSEVSLIPKVSPLGTGELLYLDGRFDYECMSGLLYAAKSNVALPEALNRNCRDRYFSRQSQLRRAGKSFDSHAPAFDPGSSAAGESYWSSLVTSVVTTLRNASTFAIRFEKIPTIDAKGEISVRVAFVGERLGAPIRLRSIPERVPVSIEDAKFASAMKANSAAARTDLGEMVSCSAALKFVRTADRGVRPATVPASEFSRYEVQFQVEKIGCSDSTKRYTMKG
jgi:hypothetical protein